MDGLGRLIGPGGTRELVDVPAVADDEGPVFPEPAEPPLLAEVPDAEPFCGAALGGEGGLWGACCHAE